MNLQLMLKRIVQGTVAAALFAISVLIVTTDSLADRADRRQHRQGARIRQGVKSGEITRGEAKHLRKQQRRIRRVEKRAESDGTVTDQEQQRLENMQDRASKTIFRAKHNEKDRNSDDQ